MFELVAEVLDVKAKAGRRPATLNDYKFVFNRFNRSYGQRRVHEVHRDDVEDYLARIRHCDGRCAKTQHSGRQKITTRRKLGMGESCQCQMGTQTLDMK